MLIKLESTMSNPLMLETVWFDKYKYDDAEKQYYEQLVQRQKGAASPMRKAGPQPSGKQAKKAANQANETQPSGKVSNKKSAKKSSQSGASKSSLIDEIARARQHIKESLQSADTISLPGQIGDPDLCSRVQTIELETQEIRKIISDVQNFMRVLETRVGRLEELKQALQADKSTDTKPYKPEPAKSDPQTKEGGGDEDDDLDLFGSDEDNKADALREQRLKAYQEKKAKKPALIAKSSVVIDVKPWDDETDMEELERQVRAIQVDGLVWGASKLVPLAYGIKKLQIVCIVEDDKVSIDELQETIQELEDLVQSTDIAAFNKL